MSQVQQKKYWIKPIKRDKKRVSKGLWVWGQFNHDSVKRIESAKKIANNELMGVNFEAHITLSGPFQGLGSHTFKKLQYIANRFNKIKIFSNKIETKEDFFQALFLKIQEKKDLLELKKFIDKELALPHIEYFPHISLFYGDQPEDKKNEVVSKISTLRGNFILDRISLVDVDEEARQWKVIETYLLQGNATCEGKT